MNKTILLVEDNASDEKLTLLAFKNCGISNEVTVARDGAAALDYKTLGLFWLLLNETSPADRGSS